MQRPSSDLRSRALTDREEEVARRVRTALHLSASMTEREVAQQLRGSIAWRKARLRLAGEELRGRLAEVLRPLTSRIRTRVRPLVRHVEGLWNRLWR